jgi:hypothetical protein
VRLPGARNYIRIIAHRIGALGAPNASAKFRLALSARSHVDRPLCVAAAFFMMQESARFSGKCTIAVQFKAASITSVFRKRSVVKDRFSSAVKPVNRMYNEGC